jgi:predicted outer membrane protein
MKMRTLTAIYLAMAAVCAAQNGPEYASPPPAAILSTEISGGDLVFFTGAGPETALMEEISALAQKQAVTPEVKALAGIVLKEQSDAAEQLKGLAAAKNVPISQEPDMQGRKEILALAKVTGPRFDKSFLDALGDVQDLLETSLEAGAASSDKEIKAYADAGLETLKKERDGVRRLGL